MSKRIEITCISCPLGCDIELEVDNNNQIKTIVGNSCPTGKEYVKEEYYNPTRILPTTVQVTNGVLPLAPVKSEHPLPKKLLEKAMKEIAKVEIKAPVKLGDIIIENILDTDINIVATRDLDAK